ncbi:MAG: response regulator [Planctomycetota bacterium]
MPRKPLSILLVEDDEAHAEVVRLALDEAGVGGSLTVAPSSEAAWDLLRGTDPARKIQKPFVAIIDLRLPGASGIEFLDSLRQDPEFCDSVVFVLSGTASQDDVEEVYERNVAGYVRKDSLEQAARGLAELLGHFQRSVVLPGEPLY